MVYYPGLFIFNANIGTVNPDYSKKTYFTAENAEYAEERQYMVYKLFLKFFCIKINPDYS